VLTLTKVQDGCIGRANALTAQPWDTGVSDSEVNPVRMLSG
jgi:hypothetical protein